MTTVKPVRLRVVFDTNVYFSAFSHPIGTPYRIWQEVIRQSFALVVSPAIIRELAGALRDKASWDDERILASMKLIAKVGDVVTPRVFLQVVADDPDDDHVLECAVAGRANLIVSGDRHLRRLKSFEGIAIVTPKDFLRIAGL